MQSQPMQLLTSHKTDAWFTPSRYIELARSVLGWIDLDPASDPLPQRWIQANTFWTKADDALNRTWEGHATVFLNPPYGKEHGKSSQEAWTRKACAEFKAGHFDAGILLVNSTHGYKWYEDLWVRYPVCCVKDRIRFIDHEGNQGGQAKRGQTFVYLGPDVATFSRVFSTIGRIIVPEHLQPQFRRLQRLDWTAAMGIGGFASPDVARNALVM